MHVAAPAQADWIRVRDVAGAIAAGVVLGMMSRFWDRLDSQVAWIFNIGGPWLACAFVFGAIIRRWRAAAIGGALLLMVAVGIYYAFSPVFQAEREVEAVVRLTILWGGVGGIGGAVMGAAGAVWRTSAGTDRAFALSLFTGALLGEGVLLYLRPGRDGALIFGAEIIAGLLLPVVLLRNRRERFECLAMTFALAVVALASVVLVRLAARASFIIIPPNP